MKPPPFAYADPATLSEAVSILGEYGAGAKVIAGGQSLIPLLNFRLSRPQVVVDLKRIPELRGIAVTDNGLRVGALVRQAELEEHPEVASRWPLLKEAIGHIGHPQIRNRGTIGGSIVHNDPSAELPAIMVALNAAMVAQGPRGSRTIAASDFFVTYLTTALQPDELLQEIQIPALPAGTGWGFAEVARRHGDFALAAAAALILPGGSPEIRLVVTGVGNGPVRVAAAEQALSVHGTGEAGLIRATAQIDAVIDPPDDVHGSAAYRRKVIGAMVRRAVTAAANRVGR